MTLPVSAWWIGRKLDRNISPAQSEEIRCPRGPTIIRETERRKSTESRRFAVTRITRRKLLSKGAQSIAVGSALTALPTLQTRAFGKESVAGTDYYQKLGVTP